jgi:hypothetical protein
MAKTKSAPIRETSPDDLIEQAFAKRDEYEDLRRQAVDALLAKRKDIEQNLASLGYKIDTPGPTASAPRRAVAAKPCKICGELGHDARKHRYDKGNEGSIHS